LEAFPDAGLAVDPRDEGPVGLQRVLTASSRPIVRPVARAALEATVRVAGASRAWPIEMAAARVLRQVEMIAGFQSTAEAVISEAKTLRL
jgi:hypothetical protein